MFVSEDAQPGRKQRGAGIGENASGTKGVSWMVIFEETG
jgi:hypothetical protein